MLGVAGVTAIDTTLAAVMVSVVELFIEPDVAVIVTEPTEPALVDANPELLMVAEPVPLVAVHVTLPVIFCVELSV
jgi:hypothetical protein